MEDADDHGQQGQGVPGMHRDHAAPLTARALFDLLWEALADVLGTAATAALIRRAARRAAPGQAQLHQLDIRREGLDYAYSVPPAWEQEHHTVPALRALVRELRPLLVELTGLVLVRRLEGIADLQRSGILSPEESL